MSQDKDNNEAANSCAAVAEGVDTESPAPVIVGGKFYYTAGQMTTYGAQQREAGRLEGIAIGRGQSGERLREPERCGAGC